MNTGIPFWIRRPESEFDFRFGAKIQHILQSILTWKIGTWI